MDEATLFQLLKTTSLPVAYHHFVSPPTPPYVVYYEAEAEARGCDEKNRIRDSGWIVEVYTVKKQPDIQKLVESLLDERGIEWRMTFSGLIESEGLYMAAYTFGTTRKIRRN